MKKMLIALVIVLTSWGPAMAGNGWLYALEGALGEVQRDQAGRARDEAEAAEMRERIERAAEEQRAEMRAQQIRAAAEQASFETFMLRHELRRQEK